MKLKTLSALHYLILFSLVLLFVQVAGISAPKTNEPLEKTSTVSVRGLDNPPLAKDNSSELLHGELLFR